MSEVPSVRTKPTTDEWRSAILAAAQRLGVTLDDNALSVLWAQWALETGRGDACHCNNLGNIKYSGEGDWCWLQTFEYIDNRVMRMPDKFRAFATLDAGAYDYLRFLCRPAYLLPWSHVIAGDADGFARALRVKGYFTAPVEEYAKGLRSLAAEYLRAISRAVDTGTVEQPPTQPDGPANPLGWADRAEAIAAEEIESEKVPTDPNASPQARRNTDGPKRWPTG